MSDVSLSVTSRDIDGLIARLRRAKSRITTQTRNTGNTAMAQARRTVQTGTPVRTGRARAGWYTLRTGDLSWTLTNDVPYLIFLVLGTRYMFPVKTLNDAIDQAQRQIEQSFAGLGATLAAVVTKDFD